jgi:chromosome partitioning protein
LGPDLFSLQGLRNLGPTLRNWRAHWSERLERNPNKQLILPTGQMKPVGYIVMQHSVRRDRPVKSYDKWIARMPEYYRKYVLGKPANDPQSIENDKNCLALLKHYRSLMPMAQEARKPMFQLKPADGAIGAHVQAVQDSYRDFKKLSLEILRRAKVSKAVITSA